MPLPVQAFETDPAVLMADALSPETGHLCRVVQWQADAGYDVADYCDIDPRYGTLDDAALFDTRTQRVWLGLAALALCEAIGIEPTEDDIDAVMREVRVALLEATSTSRSSRRSSAASRNSASARRCRSPSRPPSRSSRSCTPS